MATCLSRHHRCECGSRSCGCPLLRAWCDRRMAPFPFFVFGRIFDRDDGKYRRKKMGCVKGNRHIDGRRAQRLSGGNLGHGHDPDSRCQHHEQRLQDRRLFLGHLYQGHPCRHCHPCFACRAASTVKRA